MEKLMIWGSVKTLKRPHRLVERIHDVLDLVVGQIEIKRQTEVV